MRANCQADPMKRVQIGPSERVGSNDVVVTVDGRVRFVGPADRADIFYCDLLIKLIGEDRSRSDRGLRRAVML